MSVKTKSYFLLYLSTLIVSPGAENKFLVGELILNSFPICPQSPLSQVSDDISKPGANQELCQINIK